MTGGSAVTAPVPARLPNQHRVDAVPVDPDQLAAAERLLLGLPPTARILLLCHVNPDGDALGSMLGFALGLRRMGYTCLQASFPGSPEVPDPLRGLPGMDMLVRCDDLGGGHDAVLVFDAASLGRLADLGRYLDEVPVSVVFDHHASNTRFGDINLVEPSAAATSVVAERLLARLGVELDAEIAECLYVALATDTGSFRFTGSAEMHSLAARLLETGISAVEISRRLFDTRPVGAIRLFGDVLGRIVFEPEPAGGLGLVWTYATLDDLERHGQRPHVLEALIDPVRGAEEAEVACVLKQVGPAEWSVSLRSKGHVDVSAVAVALGGGGHRAAAGFTCTGQVPDVMASIRAALAGG